MILKTAILTKDDEALITERISAYYGKLGYKVKQSDSTLKFRRGSSMGTWLAFTPMKWKVETIVEFKRESPKSAEVSLVYIIYTAGQLVANYERKFWETELEGAERALMTGEINYGESIKLANEALNKNLLSYLVLGLITITCGFIGLFVIKSLAAACILMVIGLVIWWIILKYWQQRKIKK
jgi:hypothetical protein